MPVYRLPPPSVKYGMQQHVWVPSVHGARDRFQAAFGKVVP